MRRSPLLALVVASGLSFACSSSSGSDSDGSDGSEPKEETQGIPPDTEYPEGLTSTDEGLVYTTAEFTVPAGEEKFLCYTIDLEQDREIDAYAVTSRPVVHHLVFAATGGSEPLGYSECNVIFRPTWEPFLITTTADTTLETPEGTANIMPTGTRLLVQLHLLNTTPEPVTDHAVIRMRESKTVDPTPVGIYAMGTTNIQVPPQQTTSLTGTCAAQDDVQLFAMMPHMHYLGRAMTLEVGPDESSLETIFTSDPYDFDNQEVEPLDFTIPAGSTTRTTCTYDNNRDQMATFGESSFDEMCFAIGFAVGFDGVSGCIEAGSGEEVPRDPEAGACEDVVPNDLGIGARCTEGGGECNDGLECSADLRPSENGEGYCLRLGCTDAADCGGGSATCCSFGITDLCTTEACRPLNCVPK